MKNPKLFLRLGLIVLLFLNLHSFAQTLTPKYNVSMTSNTKGYYEYLPQGYSSTGSQTYPVIITIHGTGELGQGNTSSLKKILNNGPIRTINQGKFPTSFTVNGKQFKFIVIAPQFVAWPQPAQIDAIIDYVLRNYKVDPTRIYLTGLSMGGGAAWEYAGSQTRTDYPKRLAALAPVCGAAWPNTYKAKGIANANLPVWAFHNQGDPQVPSWYTNDFIKYISAIVPTINPLPRKTIFPVSGHDAWTKAYDPLYKENNKNVYEWMLGYTRGGVAAPPPANVTPVVNAGNDKTITLPTSTVALSATASDADGTIASWAWTKTSGPTSFAFSSTTIASPTLSKLVAGTYTFKVTVTDNKGATASDNVNVIVNPAVAPRPPANQAPVINAGTDKLLILPTNSCRLNATATDADGKIARYYWQKASGPTTYKMSSTSAVNPEVSGLVEGTYTFRVTATDDDGATDQDDVVVVVKKGTTTTPAPTAGEKLIQVRLYSGSNVYNTMQWNNWNVGTGSGSNKAIDNLKYKDGTASGVKAALTYTEAVADNSASYGSGIAPADVLRYTSYATSSRTLTLTGLVSGKTYDIELYSSRNNTGNQTRFIIGSKQITVNSSKNKTEKASFASLTADAQGKVTVSIQRVNTFSYLNGFTIKEKTGGSAAKGEETPETSALPVIEEKEVAQTTPVAGFSVYPNPVQDRVVLQLNNDQKGRLTVQLFDLGGRLIRQFTFSKDQEATQVYISLGDLKPGQYILKAAVGSWTETKKLTRL